MRFIFKDVLMVFQSEGCFISVCVCVGLGDVCVFAWKCVCVWECLCVCLKCERACVSIYACICGVCVCPKITTF